ncbi:phage baseplate assembly protein V [Paludibacterium yongneupense]|uniref:phage baseplate assembly protein V n=1 Tax=Paludibacterium yongneupense TaxID=400061 RepID=UPI00040960E4|nr:phage baseplate assembly protein V [Paludibacterium yongneupense]
MWDQIDARVQRALGRIRLAFRGVLTMTGNGVDSQLAQVEGLASEPLPDCELFQHFGFTSNPPPGTVVVVLPVGGRTGHGIIVATENGDYRVSGLAPGETAIFNAFGDTFVFKDGQILGTTKTFTLTATEGMKFDSPTAQFTGQVIVDQQLSGNGGLAVQGGDGATFSGSVKQTGGSFTTDQDVVASGKSLAGHEHEVIALGAPSSPPL